MEKFTINGKVCQAKDIDFNFICTLEDAGISLEEIGKKITSTMRCYVATCLGVSYEKAGEEIQAHIISGGKMDDIMNTLNSKLEESDFFQALNKQAEKENPAESKKKGQEASE